MAAWRRHGRISLCLLPLVLVLLMVVRPARAQFGEDRFAAIVIEANSGKVLQEYNADAPRRPASLTKLMTLYMAFEALRDRRISLDEAVPFSENAASMIPTKLGVPVGGEITVEQAILAMVTLSANDAAAALGELLGGDEYRFAQMMTLRGRALGMTHTTFANASGLPANDQWTTARDLAVLARRLILDFPEDYHYFSTPNFVFHGRVILNHDTELRSYPGADGLKTGYTQASGHNLITSAVRDGVRLIGVELGAPSNGVRDVRMTALLNSGYQGLGVPVARAPLVASRLPTLIPVAQAEEIAHPGLRKVAMRLRPAETDHPEWAIQVGSYRSVDAAREASARARQATGAGEVLVTRAIVHHESTWRAQVVGLSSQEARDACTTLSRHRTRCMVIHVDADRQVARS
jgi:D-alanyl-D-alanine carboxypeptidase